MIHKLKLFASYVWQIKHSTFEQEGMQSRNCGSRSVILAQSRCMKILIFVEE